jgi:hypothetical protein
MRQLARSELAREADGVRPESEYNNRLKGRDKNREFYAPQNQDYAMKSFSRGYVSGALTGSYAGDARVLNLLDDGRNNGPRAGLGLDKPFELQP